MILLHMTWWRKAWWVRMDSGPHLRTARDRRKVWRAATRAAQEVRETGKVAGRKREEWEKRETERRESNTLHIVMHLQTTSNNHCNKCNHGSSSNCSSTAKCTTPMIRSRSNILVKLEGESLQPHRLTSSLATSLRKCRICCSSTLLPCQWVRRMQMSRRSSSNATLPFPRRRDGHSRCTMSTSRVCSFRSSSGSVG